MKSATQKRKTKALFVLLLAAVFALTACGGNKSETAATDGSSTPSASQGASSEGTKPSGGKTVELELFQFAGPAEAGFNEMIARFEAKYPNIKIKQNIVPDAFNVLDMRMASGDAPDLFNYGVNQSFRSFVDNDLLVDLTGEPYMSNIQPQALAITEYQGKQYGLPAVYNTYAVYYNKRIFHELGIEIPSTREELLAAADKIQAAGIAPFAFPDKDMALTGGLDFLSYTGSFSDDPDRIFQEVIDGKAHLTDSEELKKIASFYIDVRKYNKDSLGVTMNEGFNQFASEKAAMMIYIDFTHGVIKGINPELEFAAFPIPGDDSADTRLPLGIGFQLSISKDSKHVEEAKKFLEFWAQPENAAVFDAIQMSPSAVNGVESQVKETELLRKYIADGRVFPWPGIKTFKTNHYNDLASYLQFLIQTKDVDSFLQSLDGVFYGVK